MRKGRIRATVAGNGKAQQGQTGKAESPPQWREMRKAGCRRIPPHSEATTYPRHCGGKWVSPTRPDRVTVPPATVAGNGKARCRGNLHSGHIGGSQTKSLLSEIRYQQATPNRWPQWPRQGRPVADESNPIQRQPAFRPHWPFLGRPNKASSGSPNPRHIGGK